MSISSDIKTRYEQKVQNENQSMSTVEEPPELPRSPLPRSQAEWDAHWMLEAVKEGDRGRLITAPNPWVGCVIVNRNRIIGRGFHRGPNTPHAEPMAVWDALYGRGGGHSTCTDAVEAEDVEDVGSCDHAEQQLYNLRMQERLASSDTSELLQDGETTLYTTLEPCHAGPGKRTPPCDALIVRKGIKRVCIGLADADSTFGNGRDFLRQNGVEVVSLDTVTEDERTTAEVASSAVAGLAVGTGASSTSLPSTHVGQDSSTTSRTINIPAGCTSTIVARARAACLESLRPYLYHRRTGMAYCVLKIACSMDGKIACADDTSQWITMEKARQDSHLRFRACSQAMIVGSSTYLKDRPRLNVRLGGFGATAAAGGAEARGDGDGQGGGVRLKYRDPLRVVVDTRGRLAEELTQRGSTGDVDETAAAPAMTPGARPWLVITSMENYERLASSGLKNAEIVAMPTSPPSLTESNHDSSIGSFRGGEAKIDMRAVLKYLAKERGVLQATVEGGSVLQGTFLRANLVQEIGIYQGACLLGRTGRSWATEELTTTIADANFWTLRNVTKFDNDVLLEYIRKEKASSYGKRTKFRAQKSSCSTAMNLNPQR